MKSISAPIPFGAFLSAVISEDTVQSFTDMLEISNLRSPLIGPVSLSVGGGECVAIEGRSGAGKSLFLRAIADLDPNEGSVVLRTDTRDRMEAHLWRSRVALLPAESGWWSDGVREHFPDVARAGTLFRALGLEDALDWSVDRLSTGERQRLALARALVSAPEVLLLDEPTAALDSASVTMVETLLTDELARGVAMILVTHDPDQARRFARRCFRMADGRLSPATEMP